MTTISDQIEWRVIGETVPGASHLRAGVPNQDAILQLRESSLVLPIMLSISDGHGSDKCFRSDRGSRYAVRKAIQVINEFLEEQRGKFDLTEIESKGKEFLPKEFLREWRNAVESNLKSNPFTIEELDKLKEKDGEKSLKLIEDNPLLAYGATSLTVAVGEDFILYLQLGDGAIITVSEKGEVTKPLPDDDRLFANETTSLCSPKAENDFRFFVQKISAENKPALILLSTDGYVNSFSDESGFLQVGTDLLEMLRSNDFDLVNASLKSWLEEATKTGSGDDCTVGIICRMDALKKPEPAEHPKTTAVENTSQPIQSAEPPVNIPPTGEMLPENQEDVTVTITIKKDKNKISASPVVSVNKPTEDKQSVNKPTKDSPSNAIDNAKETL